MTDVNDNSPVFVSPPAGAVLENSASGTEVMTVRARDKDANRNGQVGLTLLITNYRQVGLPKELEPTLTPWSYSPNDQL